MPVISAISPKYIEGLSIEALHNAGLLTDTSMKMYTPQNLTRLNRFESVFQFFTVPDSSKGAEIFHHVMALSALVSCGSLFLRTLDGPNLDSLYPDYPSLPDDHTYKIIDGVFTVLFSLDFVIRLIIWPSLWKESDVLRERRLLPFARDIFNWFDLLALVPFYVDTIFGDGTSFVVMRLARLLRIFRLAKNNSGTYILFQAIRASMPGITIALIFLLEIVLVFSCLMYLFDPCYNKDACMFPDLLTSAYYVVVTVATVGYGDVVPSAGNALGRITAIVIMIMGTLFLSMPLAIVGTEFDRAWRDHTEKVVKRSLESMQAAAAGRDASKVHDTVMDDNPEILTKYMIPNAAYLRLASLTGEMALIASALAADLKSETDNVKVNQVAQDLHAHMKQCHEKYKELVHVIDDMVHQDDSSHGLKRSSLRDRIMSSFQSSLRRSLTTEDKSQPNGKTAARPDTTSSQRIQYRWVIMVFSIIVLTLQTMPELQFYGEQTELCKAVVKEYCALPSAANATADPGCFSAVDPTQPLDFSCGKLDGIKDMAPNCYGVLNNFGGLYNSSLGCLWDNGNFNLTGLGLVKPFRTKYDLDQADLPLDVCQRRECQRNHFYYLDLSNAWPLLEYLFFASSVVEFFQHLGATGVRNLNWKNPWQWLDALAFIPFVVFEFKRYMMGIIPTYEMVPSSNDILSTLRFARIFRWFQIQKEIPATVVVSEAILKTYKRLVIPYFMLTLVTTIFAFVIYQLEMGTECFVGEPCVVGGKVLTKMPEATKHMKFHKRILIDSKGNLTQFEDVFSGIWFIIVTITSVGYGDIVPINMSGKFIAVLAMIFGACYTAMPLTLVGSQFNRSFNDYKRREALTKTKQDVSTRLALAADDERAWKAFKDKHLIVEIKSMFERDFLSLINETESEERLDSDGRSKKLEVVATIKTSIEIFKVSILQSSSIVSRIYHEGLRLAKQQTLALHKTS
ncbi:hypothetical protein H257_00320 [Aphanomyces astaci]|uniref:Ion transport domain-containing protein n=1 Tax=Aphanomyces astaci TaxID=112090 RepID=W4HA74_APHAT|nr:hypothetical protein H257_00320 [Aphanomyces astaci]ETV88832.1 hypothetical protein H257_00320 [Aphanomyces astaci]|eukprot:XP_009821232.1 hypothetical protein H257_00320 [Aphanomyces astaci]